MIRIGLIQMHCEKSQIHKNLETIAHHLEEATNYGINIIGFPEMCLTGYAVPTKYPEAMLDLHGPEVAQLLKLTEPYPATVLVGLIEKNPVGKPYITQIVIRHRALLGCYRKITIKDEEVEWFSPGQDVPIFQCGGLNFGPAICADIANEKVFAECHRQGATIVFELVAPGLYGEQATRNWPSGYAWWESECQKYLSRYAREYGLWVGVATQAGRTIDEDFPGGGYVYAPTGECVVTTFDWLPGAGYVALDLETHQAMRLDSSSLSRKTDHKHG